jgi:hypothetical protein
MARLPSHIMARITARVPYGQDGIWQAIREHGTITVTDILERVAADRRTVEDYLRRLEMAGFVGRSAEHPARWEMLIDDPETPRLRKDGTPAADIGRGQDCLWRTMKMLGAFDAESLAAAASLPEVPIRTSSAARYLKQLHAAGYLIIVRPPQKGFRGRTVYALDPTRNTGPRAPQVQASDCVFDPNTAEIHDIHSETRRVS